MRLDKYISSQRTDLSRSDVKKLVRAGKVAVNGTAAKKPEMNVDPADTVEVCGEIVGYKEHIYIMLNKPQGCICSTRAGRTPTVLELVPEELRRRGLFPAGRLDKDTEGFVLITDDGELAHNMLAPSRHVPKTYYVRLEKPYDPACEALFAEGITIDGGEVCLPAECCADGDDPHACALTLHEGKFHQVKRMFQAVGMEVTYLKRESMGSLVLDETLKPGEYRDKHRRAGFRPKFAARRLFGTYAQRC